MARALKTRASKQAYTGSKQLILSGFESQFSHHLLQSNRWVKLVGRIPWDALVNTYYRQLGNQHTGASSINPRVASGALIIKHLCDLSDRETILQIQENMYMQYFIGYTSFTHKEAFDPSLLVDIRKRLSLEHINEINEKILGLIKTEEEAKKRNNSPSNDMGQPNIEVELRLKKDKPADDQPGENKGLGDVKKPNTGSLIMDVTARPQDIAYPTDLNLLNDSREKSEESIDILHSGLSIHV